MKNCTGANCPMPMQYCSVDPATCVAVKECIFATPPKTNADCIRAMSDEELAELFWIRADCKLCPNRKQYCSDDCKGAWLNWLKQEAEGD